MAKGFAANGATVYIAGRREHKLVEAKALLEALKSEAAEVRM